MEHQLGLLADAVLIIVESPGTFAELGAFSLSPSLREKLLPILDIAYKGAGSFISSGPVRWVDSESIFKPSIYANFGDFLELARQIEERLKRIRRTSEEQVTDLASKPKHLLFLLCDLLAIIGPATATDCSYYLESILGARPSWSVPSLLGLGVSLRIIGYFDTRTATRFYYRPVTDDRLLPFQHRTMFDLTVERARFLSVLQKIDQAREAISLLEAR